MTPDRVQALAAFMASVTQTPACWLWCGPTQKPSKPYGMYKGKLAHRVSWTLHHGPIPPSLFVCHHCDNYRCVRPDHLFLGTASTNALDAVRKGRWPHNPSYGRANGMHTQPASRPRGRAHGRAKVTDDDVRTIRRDIATVSRQQLAIRFAVSERTIGRIVSRENWSHVQ